MKDEDIKTAQTSEDERQELIEEIEQRPARKAKNAKPQNIAKSQAQLEAEARLNYTPEVADLIDKVLEDEEREREEGQSKLALFAKKKSRKEAEFAAQLSSAVRYQPEYTQGLTIEQVEERKAKLLVNEATASNAKTYKSIFFQNIVTFFNLLCVGVAVALIVVQSFTDIFFLVIMMCNVVISIWQEIKAKRTIEKLSLISAPAAVVVRNGEKITVPVNEVVLDDILYLENGKQIPTDCIIVRGEMEVNESLLTGESVPVLKKQDQIVYGGSFVSGGSCFARADKVGSANYIENLTAFAKKYKRARSELLNSLRLIITIIGVAVVPLTIGLYLKNLAVLGRAEDAIPRTAGAIIGMIPAGMFLLTSIALSMSVVRLAKNNVLVQDLYCIEMLARVNVLCLDKTGTITDGTMQVNEVIEFKNNNETGAGLADIVGSILTATNDNNQTAVALIDKFGYSKLLKPETIVPFSSQRKVSAVTFEDVGTFIMGAPEFIIKDMGVRLERLITQKAKEGLRVLMVAHAAGEIKNNRIPVGRKPIALIIIEDHIRSDAPETLKWFTDNGVQLKVISGDNPVTVSEVARRAGVPGAAKYVSLEGLTDPEVVELANQYTVFGRVTPEQKKLLIKSIKVKGNTVAMTGDGVNDILALKEADCSVAMASGSEAARNVSHMVLLDSNFANMPSVVHEGRRVVNNIQKSSSLFLMKTVFSIVLTVLVIILPNLAYPVSPSNLLPLEFFIIGVPSFCLAFQSNNSRISGKFLYNIIRSAIPAGLTLVLSFLTLYVIDASFPEVFRGGDLIQPLASTDVFKTSAIISITFTGSIMLLKLCMPFDTYRITVWGGCVLFCVLAFLFLGQTAFLMLVNLNLTQVLLALLVIETSFVVVTVLTAALSRIKVQ